MLQKLIIVLFTFISVESSAQGTSYFKLSEPLKKDRPKPVKYNAFGAEVFPAMEMMFGGNHISYRKIGIGLSWRVGYRNMQIARNGLSVIDYDTARVNNFLTGRSKTTYSFGGSIDFVIPITKKIPFYVGVGVTRKRVLEEALPPYANPGEEEWILNPHKTRFDLNLSCGVFVPLFSRLVLNVGYDHKPQMIFAGIAISGPFNYEDIDMW